MTSPGAVAGWRVHHGLTARGGRRGVCPRRHSPVTRAAVIEPGTKTSFPDMLEGAALTCVGAGVREKKVAIVNVKVYAVALYVDASPCKAELAAGKSLLHGAFDKALLIQMARDVDGKTFWEALDQALTPRIRGIATDMATKEDDEGNFMSSVAEAAEVAEESAMDQCDDLRALFSGQNLKKATQVLIKWCPGSEAGGVEGSLEVGVVGGAAALSLSSMELAQALFDVYLGDAPISTKALEAFQAGAAAL
mmetsp:Transcript_32744/g.52486  ORF Transcript_32744/g.52486 Transcript_32744/m.52486 type:complete len:250 (-) Transcript_32744:291-1040(-)